MRAIVSILCAAWFTVLSGAWALGVEEPLPDAAQEARARDLFRQLRCVVCQGESLADSPADIAIDMRRDIRVKIAAGKKDEEIIGYLAGRYGDVVLMRPPVASAPLLWMLPFLIVGAAGAMVFFYFRKREG